MTQSIPCQACVGKPKEDGCATCGGFKEVLFFAKACNFCERQAWFRPGVHTVYVGKHYSSVDGLEIVCTGMSERTCIDCYKKDKT